VNQTPDTMPELLYAASKRNVIALDPFTGDEVWNTRLPKMTGSYISLFCTPHTLFVARSNGFIYAMHKYTGEILWEKEIKDLRHQPIALASSSHISGSSDLTSQAAAAAAQAAAAAAAMG